MFSIRDQASYGNNIVKSEEEKNVVYNFKYPCEDYSVCQPIDITFSPGFYFLECWGASGSYVTYGTHTGKGGTGGYLSGVLIVKRKTRYFLYIGASKNLTAG